VGEVAEDNLEKCNVLVVFKERVNLPKKVYLNKKFQHCLVYLKTMEGWRVFESTIEGLIYNTIRGVEINDISKANLEMGNIVLYGYRFKAKKRVFKSKAENCVTISKRLINLHNSLILTPFQLYLYLRILAKWKKYSDKT
jgi:hypothetical protein